MNDVEHDRGHTCMYNNEMPLAHCSGKIIRTLKIGDFFFFFSLNFFFLDVY